MNDQNNGNELANEYMDQIYDCFSVVLEDGESKVPGSKKEIEESRELLRKAREAGPDDEEILEQLDHIETLLEESIERKFAGSKWIIICVGLVILFVTWLYGVKPIFSKVSLETAERALANSIRYTEQDIQRYQQLPDTDSTKEEKLEKAQEKLEKYQEMTAEDYQKDWRGRRVRGGFKSIFRRIPLMILLVLYYFASMTPVFLLNRRRREMAAIGKTTNIFKKVIFGIIGFFMAMPITTYVTKYSDGTKSEDSDALPMLFLKIIVPVLIFVFIVAAMMYVLPFLTLINYLRNYQYERVDAVFTKITQKLTGLFGKKA